jgi:vibriolysin
MKKRPILIASFVLAACSGPTVAPPSSGGGNVVRAELRQAPAVASTHLVATDLAAAVMAHLASQRNVLSLSAHDAFAPLRSHVSIDGVNHIRLQQTHDGIKVWGADIVAHVDADDQLTGIDGNLLRNLAGLDLNAALVDADALALGKRDYAAAATSGSALAYSREAAELVILPREDGTARLAWHVTFFTDPQAGIKDPGLWNYMIDAHEGTILEHWNGLHTAVAEASGPGGNARVTRTWNMNLDVTQNGTSYAMDTTQYQTSNLNHATSGVGTVYSGTSLTNFNANDPAANDAHGFAEVTIKMLKDWFNYNSIDNKGYKLPSRVHYSTNYANAFWDGTQMNYGDGDGKQLYEMSGSLDVVAHEIDHGFTSNHSNLTYQAQSGGMNESFSDIAGTSAKYYFDSKSASFNLGGDIFIQPNTYIRWMCKPSTDGQSIDNAAQYTAGLDVHFTSGVMNRAFCHAAKRLSGIDPTTDTVATGPTADGVKKAAYAWYVANANYWTASATYVQGCQGVVDAATKTLMYSPGDISALGDSWKDVGVTCNYTHVNDFTLALSPSKAMAPAGGTATFMVATTVPTGNTAQALTLAMKSTGGLTGTFSPATVMSGGTTTLTVNVPAATAPGDVAFTVTATGTANNPRSVDGTVTVTMPPPDMAMPPDMAQASNGNGEGGGAGTGGNGTGGNGSNNLNGSSMGCSVSPGSAAGSSAMLFLVLLGAAILVARRRA